MNVHPVVNPDDPTQAVKTSHLLEAQAGKISDLLAAQAESNNPETLVAVSAMKPPLLTYYNDNVLFVCDWPRSLIQNHFIAPGTITESPNGVQSAQRIAPLASQQIKRNDNDRDHLIKQIKEGITTFFAAKRTTSKIRRDLGKWFSELAETCGGELKKAVTEFTKQHGSSRVPGYTTIQSWVKFYHDFKDTPEHQLPVNRNEARKVNPAWTKAVKEQPSKSKASAKDEGKKARDEEPVFLPLLGMKLPKQANRHPGAESTNKPPRESEAEEPAFLPPLEPDFVLTEADTDVFSVFVESAGGLVRAAQVFQAGLKLLRELRNE